MRKKQDEKKKPLTLDLVTVRDFTIITGGRTPTTARTCTC
jgi:hypothetical protein